MDLRWIEDILILLEERNMTRAAERRNITQPAFSRRVRSFEEWLGTPLLERKANSIELSPSLLANEDEIKSAIHRIEELRNKIRNFRPERTHITIATQHALIFSAFPDIAALTQIQYPALDFRLRAGNRSECVSFFLRGDASVLLCYEGEDLKPFPFDNTIQRDEWGIDGLIPVVGGNLKYLVEQDGIPDDTPAIIYPDQSHFGELLRAKAMKFSTRSNASNPVYETAFSAGIREMALKGLGVGWLPMSMAYREIESGRLINLADIYQSIPLKIAFYTNLQDETSNTVRHLWSSHSDVS